MSAAAAELDVEAPGALEAYLRRTGRVGAEERVQVEPLAGGVSNATMLVRRTEGPDLVVKQALARLRVATPWYAGRERVAREAAALRWLDRLLPAGAVPAYRFEDPAVHLLGMDAVAEPHENWKLRLLAGGLEERHVRAFAALLAHLHCAGHEHREALADELADRSFFEALRLAPYYLHAGEQVPEAADFLGALVERTRARADTLVHGDFSPKNVLLHRDRLVLLDHEVAHLGEPAFDVGFALTHLLSKAHHLRDARERFASAAELFWRVYREGAGGAAWTEGLDARAVDHVLGCLLARVAGRSPLEYLDAGERAAQRAAVVALLEERPATVPDLVAGFCARLP
jgi:aminoglycoside phosphotransferase (APT) family kinase protein